MTTTYGGDNAGTDFTNDAILFLRMMIPHHQNAVNMAKPAWKIGPIECGGTGIVEEGTDIGPSCVLDAIVRGIVNSQNKQIQTMKSILTGFFNVAEFADCDVPTKDGDVPVKMTNLEVMLMPSLEVPWPPLPLEPQPFFKPLQS